MSDQTSPEQSQDEVREQLRKQLQEKFGDVESIEVESLLDEALDHVSGGAMENTESDICSWMWCSNATTE